MADEQTTQTPIQQTPDVKKEETSVSASETTTPVSTDNEVGEKASEAAGSEEKKSEKLEEDLTANTKSPKQTQKRKSSKSRSRSNSANRGATSKEWKPKETTKTSTINANAPPFVAQQHHTASAVREEIQQARAVEEAQAIEVTEPGHYLNTPWTFWFSRKNKKGKAPAEATGDAPAAEDGEKDKEKEKAPQQPTKGKKKKENPHRALLTPLGTVNTVEEFWAHYCYLQKPSALPKESNYSFFRHKSEPMWETYPKGGCFIVRVKKHNGKLDQMWEELIFAAIGESFEDPNVVGVVVSIRSKEDALSVWTKNHANPNRTKIGEKLKEFLELDETNTVLGYKTNASSMRDKSTYKNAKKIILAS